MAAQVTDSSGARRTNHDFADDHADSVSFIRIALAIHAGDGLLRMRGAGYGLAGSGGNESALHSPLPAASIQSISGAASQSMRTGSVRWSSSGNSV